MSLIDLYIKDNESGEIHRIGDNQHDMLTIDKDGNLLYQNLQNGDGAKLGVDGWGYSFVPNTDVYGYNCNPRELTEEELAEIIPIGKHDKKEFEDVEFKHIPDMDLPY